MWKFAKCQIVSNKPKSTLEKKWASKYFQCKSVSFVSQHYISDHSHSKAPKDLNTILKLIHSKPVIWPNHKKVKMSFSPIRHTLPPCTKKAAVKCPFRTPLSSKVPICGFSISLSYLKGKKSHCGQSHPRMKAVEMGYGCGYPIDTSIIVKIPNCDKTDCNARCGQ